MNKAFLKKIGFAILTVFTCCSASTTVPIRFEIQPYTFGPISRDSDYSNSVTIRNILDTGRDLKFDIVVLECYYKDNGAWNGARFGYKISFDQVTPHYVGETFNFSYTIPKSELQVEYVGLCLTINQVNRSSGEKQTQGMSIETGVKTYTLNASTLNLMENNVISLPQYKKSFDSSSEQGVHNPYLEVLGLEDIVEIKNNKIPLDQLPIFHFYDIHNGETKPLNYTFLSLMAPRLLIFGSDVDTLSPIADFYNGTYFNRYVSFNLEIIKVSNGYYRFQLPSNKFLVNAYDLTMSKTSDSSGKQYYTNNIYLPHMNTTESTRKIRFRTASRITSINLPWLEATFNVYQNKNHFGSCLNSEYCIGANYA